MRLHLKIIFLDEELPQFFKRAASGRKFECTFDDVRGSHEGRGLTDGMPLAHCFKLLGHLGIAVRYVSMSGCGAGIARLLTA
jgi:hypothetical protein